MWKYKLEYTICAMSSLGVLKSEMRRLNVSWLHASCRSTNFANCTALDMVEEYPTTSVENKWIYNSFVITWWNRRKIRTRRKGMSRPTCIDSIERKHYNISKMFQKVFWLKTKTLLPNNTNNHPAKHVLQGSFGLKTNTQSQNNTNNQTPTALKRVNSTHV